MRHVAQPGPASAERIQWVEARGRPLSFDLAPGRLLLDAVRDGLAAQGFASGALTLEGGALGPFAYVMPALSESGRHAAFYSATFRPPGESLIRTAAMTFGTRDDRPFFHCHALWTEAGGALRGGHVLPEETRVASRVRVRGVGLSGALFAAHPDAETNFTLFGPVADGVASSRADRRLIALRLRPNQDLAHALETFCRAQGLPGATLHGGVGSIIGARFADGRTVEPFATEMAIRAGRIDRQADGTFVAEVDAALVDVTGTVSEGRLMRGDNPVLMTLEVVLEPRA